MKELKQYYNHVFRENGMDEFDKLEDWQVKSLKSSLGFNNWQIQKEKTKIMNYFIEKTLLGKFIIWILKTLTNSIKGK